jgi:pimeloyl-ACP methyl ester carboxylesterase
LRNADLNTGTPFSFNTPNGTRLTGHLTFPRTSRLNPPPLLIDFADGLMGRPLPGFDPDAQAFAEMGFIVARINHRGGDGFGVKHRSAIHAGIDRVPVDDALAAIEWIARHHAIDRRRIATVGRGLGGYLALRATQLEPGAFRCAVALEAPLDPRAWLEPPLEDFGPTVEESPVDLGLTGARPFRPAPPLNFLQEAQRTFLAQGQQLRAERSVLRTAEQLTKPVMLVVDPSRDQTIVAQNSDLRSRLKRLGRPADYVEVGTGFAENIPGAKAKLFRQIEEFFNLNLYDYNVKVGPTTEVK